MTNCSVLFFSSSEISIPLMETLYADGRFTLMGLVCQADKPAGRKGKLKKPASKVLAERLNVPVYQPEKLSSAKSLLKDLSENPPDFILTFAYGQILNKDWLDLATVEPLNVHASLLANHRGASPIQAAILAGDLKTGVSLMRMVKEMDAGPVFSVQEIELSEEITAGFLHDEIANTAATFIPDELLKIKSGELKALAQNEDKLSYCKKISRADGQLDLTKSAAEIMMAFRAYSPWPGLWTEYQGKRLKLLDLELASDKVFTLNGEKIIPGEVVCQDASIFIGTVDGVLKLKQLQLEGKQSLEASAFILGQKGFCSSHLPS